MAARAGTRAARAATCTRAQHRRKSAGSAPKRIRHTGKKKMIIETIISTINTKGDVNFAPFGIKKRKNFVFISPYIPSKTLENLKKSGTAVINYIDDAKYFVDCLTGNKRFKKLESVKFKGFFLADSLYHEEVKVVSVKNHKIRPTFKCEIVGEFIHKKS